MAPKTFDPATDIPAQDGRVFFITGGTAGLGKGAITALAKHNPGHIYFSGRNRQSADSLIRLLQTEVPSAKLTFIQCDHTDLSSVKAAAQRFLSLADRLDVLNCNAGIMAVEPSVTKDGFEIQFAVNHLSHALLIKLLLPVMLRTAEQPGADVRIVNMTSIAYKQATKAGIEFSSLRTAQEKLGSIIPGPKWSRYGQSKLANMLYPQALASRYPSVTSVSVHPGVIMTGLFENVSLITKLPVLLASIGKKTPVEQGPYNQLWASTVDKSKLVNGEYYEPIGVVGQRATAAARNEKLADELWEWSQKELEAY